MLLKTVLDSLFTLVQLRNEDPQRAAAVNLSLVRAFGQAHARPPCLLAPQGNLTSVRKNGVNRLLLNVSGRGVSRGSGRIRRGAIRRGVDAAFRPCLADSLGAVFCGPDGGRSSVRRVGAGDRGRRQGVFRSREPLGH